MGFHGFLMDFIRFVTWNLTVRNEDFMGFQLIFRDLMGQVFLPISPSTVGMNGIKKIRSDAISIFIPHKLDYDRMYGGI